MTQQTTLQTMHKLLAFAIPVSMGGIINMTSSFIAMMMVAQLGQQPLAAGALATTTYITIMTISATIFYAVGIMISHQRGQNKSPEEIGMIVKNGFWLAMFIFMPAALLLWHIDKILFLFGQNPQLIALTRGYFHYAAIAMLPLLINAVIAQFYAGIGKPRVTMFISFISLPLTVLASYGFVLGHFGLPTLGLSGITCANLVVQSLLTFSIFVILLARNKNYGIFAKPFTPNLSICKSIIALGLPIGIQFGGEIAAMTIATYFMGYFGVVALAASQVVSQYSLIIVMINVGLTQAIAILISEAYGTQNVYLIKKYLSCSFLLLSLCFVVVWILFFIFPTELVTFYVNRNIISPQFLFYTKIFFLISAIMLFVDGIRNLLSGALRGLYDSRAPMRIGVISLWILSLPASYFVGFIFHGGPIGLRIAFCSGFIVAAIILWRRMQHKLNYLERDLHYEKI